MTKSHRTRLRRRDDVLHHAVGEVFLLGVCTDVLERQHGEGWRFRLDGYCWAARAVLSACSPQSIHVNRMHNVLMPYSPRSSKPV